MKVNKKAIERDIRDLEGSIEILNTYPRIKTDPRMKLCQDVLNEIIVEKKRILKG